MARGELYASHTKTVGNQIDKRVVRLGQIKVHCVHHLLRRMGPSHGQHAGVHLAHQVAAIGARFGPQAPGDDDASIFGQRFANRVEAFLYRVVNEAAGVDDDQVSTFKGLGRLVALGAELRENQF